MRYILFFFICLLGIIACETNPMREDTAGQKEKINSLFASGDTINLTTSKVVSSDKLIIIDENKDTIIITFNKKTETITYTTTNPDTVIKRYNKGGVVTNPPVDPKPTDPPPTNPGVRNNLVFEALFNGSNPFPTASLYKQACCSYSATQSKTIVREGDGSFRAEVKGSDPSSSSGYRSEFIPPTNTRLKDGWYGYSVYLEDWKSCGGCGEHIMQWHPDNGSGSAVLAIYTEKNSFHVRLNPEGDQTAFTVKDGLPIQSNKWYDIVMHVVWSNDKTKGRIEMWIDGTKYIDYTGVTLTMSSVPYFKVGGINRWNLSGVTRVMYTDAVRIGNEKATYKDVAP